MPNYTLSSLVAVAIILLVGFPIHEAAHAFVAYWLGDDTAKRQGRLTLNPLKHLDVFGSLILLMTQAVGWAKPVPVSPWRLRYGPRQGGALVAAAGPVSNLLMASMAAVLWRLGLFAGAPMWVSSVILTFVALNVTLCLFNLIPLAPLDGNSVLNGVVTGQMAVWLAPLRTYGPQILLGLLLISFLPGVNILWRVLGPAQAAIMHLLLGS